MDGDTILLVKLFISTMDWRVGSDIWSLDGIHSLLPLNLFLRSRGLKSVEEFLKWSLIERDRVRTLRVVLILSNEMLVGVGMKDRPLSRISV